jgi:hypothetical protein
MQLPSMTADEKIPWVVGQEEVKDGTRPVGTDLPVWLGVSLILKMEWTGPFLYRLTGAEKRPVILILDT